MVVEKSSIYIKKNGNVLIDGFTEDIKACFSKEDMGLSGHLKKVKKVSSTQLDGFRNESSKLIGEKAYITGNAIKLDKWTSSKINKFYLDYGEEEIISPSFCVYFTGCNLSCKFCQESASISSAYGKFYSPDIIANEINAMGTVNSVSFIGGNPEHHIDYIIELLSILENRYPFVLNSNFTMSKDLLDLYIQFIDCFILDLKFGNDDCASDISSSWQYMHTLTNNIQHLIDNDPDSMIIVRHLLLPGHLKCCFLPVLKNLEPFRDRIYLSILDGYTPDFNAPYDALLKNHLTEKQKYLAMELIKHAGFNVVN